MLDEAIELQSKIAELELKQAITIRSLGRSLKLQKFYPDSFKYGPCKTGLRGIDLPHKPENAIFYIKLGNGDQVDFKLETVPFELWPKSAVSSLQRTAIGNNFIKKVMK